MSDLLERWGCLAAVLALAVACAEAPDGGEGDSRSRTSPLVPALGEAGLPFEHYNGMTGANFFVEMMGPGAAFFDADGDGDLDVFFPQGEPLGEGARPVDVPGARFFVNQLVESGRLAWLDRSQASGLAVAGYGLGVAVGDIDNDGDPDLYVTAFGPNRLFLNDGAGRFEEAPEAGGAQDERWSASASFFDYDRDGWLDLYVTNYVDFALHRPKSCSGPSGRPDYCSPNSYRGEPDSLFRNRGDGTFEDVTVKAGIARQYGNGLGVVAVDLDRDGWLDLYVANDLEPNIFWRNQGDGTFLDEAMLFGLAVNAEGKAEAGMGVVAADFDNDGDDDVFLTHLTGESNTMYRNQARSLFLDATQSVGLAVPSVGFTGFGVVAADFDSDSRLDLAVANGAVTVVEEQALAGEPYPLLMPNRLYLQTTDGFEDLELSVGAEPRVSRGLVLGDVDNDGAVDLLVVNNDGPAELLLNRAQPKRWIGFRALRNLGGVHRDAPGALVRLHVPAADGAVRPLVRRVTVDSSYLSAHDPRVLFGLDADWVGDLTELVVEVCWRGGEEGCERWNGVAPGGYRDLVEGSGTQPSGSSEGESS